MHCLQIVDANALQVLGMPHPSQRCFLVCWVSHQLGTGLQGHKLVDPVATGEQLVYAACVQKLASIFITNGRLLHWGL